MLLQPDGKIVVAGSAQYDLALARYSSDGTLDSSFNGSGTLVVSDWTGTKFEEIWAVDFQPNGRMIAVAGYSSDIRLVRFNLDRRQDVLAVNDYETLSVNVSADIVSEGSTASVTITRNNTNIAAAQTVTLGSSDISEATVPATATIAAGQASVTVNLNAVNDAVNDGTRTVTVTASATGFVAGVDTLQVTDGASTLPVAVDDSFSALEDASLIVAAAGVLSNDLAANGGPLTAVRVAGPSHGTLTLNADGSLAYTPAANWVGTDSFTYKIMEAAMESNVATVVIATIAANDPPVAVNQAKAASKNVPLSFAASDLLVGDNSGPADESSQTITVTAIGAASHGATVLNANGTVMYMPPANYTGTDSFTYTITDNGTTNGLPDPKSATATVNITVALPQGNATGGVYDENVVQPNTVDFVAAGSSLTNTQFAANMVQAYNADLGGVLDGSSQPAYARYGVHDFKAVPFNSGAVIVWPGGNSTPISGDGAYSTYGGKSVSFSFGYWIDNGLPGEHVVECGVTALSQNGIDFGTVSATARLASGGTMTASRHINEAAGKGDTFYGFTAPAGDYLLGFTLQYDGARVNGSELWFDDIGFRTAVVWQNQDGNQPPVAISEVKTTAEDTPLTFPATDLLVGDNPGPSNESGQTMTVTAIGPAPHGTAVLNANGTVVYTPAANYNGPDSFTYTITDNGTANGQPDPKCATATVFVTVTPVNDAPIAHDDAFSVNENHTLSISLPGYTSLYMTSDSGDWVGQGRTYSFGSGSGTFSPYRNFDNGVSVSYMGGSEFWSLSFAAPGNATLLPGAYPGATRFGFQASTAPGLEVSGDGHGSNTLTGTFTVQQAQYNPMGVSTVSPQRSSSIAAAPRRHCEAQYSITTRIPRSPRSFPMTRTLRGTCFPQSAPHRRRMARWCLIPTGHLHTLPARIGPALIPSRTDPTTDASTAIWPR